MTKASGRSCGNANHLSLDQIYSKRLPILKHGRSPTQNQTKQDLGINPSGYDGEEDDEFVIVVSQGNVVVSFIYIYIYKRYKQPKRLFIHYLRVISSKMA